MKFFLIFEYKRVDIGKGKMFELYTVIYAEFINLWKRQLK